MQYSFSPLIEGYSEKNADRGSDCGKNNNVSRKFRQTSKCKLFHNLRSGPYSIRGLL